MVKINFKQPKYILPIAVFIPVCFIAYYIGDMFSGDDSAHVTPSDQINANLPDAAEYQQLSKMDEMSMRYRNDDEAYTAVGSLGRDVDSLELVEQGYSNAELDRINLEEAERIRQQKELEDLQKQLASSRRRVNSPSYSSPYDDEEDDDRTYQEIIERSKDRTTMLQQAFGSSVDDEERLERQRRDSLRLVQEQLRENNRPAAVIKSPVANSDRFNTVSHDVDNQTNMLIRAAIDGATKAQEGTRIRFRLLDDVTIQDVSLPKGTYLYGIVSGFGGQRVKVNITSILARNRFIKVDLSVFDIDGMEGFYVPASLFREMVNDAAANTVSQNVSFSDNSGGYGLNFESLGLQALQNIYNSATGAIAKNLRKNKAKIKSGTIVYLINSNEAR